MPPEPSWTTHKEFGCCTACDKELFEITSRWSDSIAGHPNPLFGRVRTIGKPTEEAFRVNFELSNGSLVSITICNECYPILDGNPRYWPYLWGKIVSGAKYMAEPEIASVYAMAVLGESCPSSRIEEMIDSNRRSAEYLSSLEIVSLVSIATWKDVYNNNG